MVQIEKNETRKQLTCVESENDARATRFHELVDRDFLGVLTPEEARELAVLTLWRDAEKSAFYEELA